MITLPETIKRFRLAVYCPRAHDATSLYRAMGPLSAMEREDNRLELRPAALGPEGLELSWNWLMGCDALLVQRPWRPEQVQLIVQAKMMGLPVWVDWDDDYATVHPSNPAFMQYQGCEPYLDKATRLADIVTVSTNEIKRRRVKRGAPKTEDKIFVIPNAAQFEPQPNDKPRERRVCWRGGASHEFDLLWTLASLSDLARDPKFTRWDWVFLGDMPWQVSSVIPNDRLIADFGAEPYFYMEAMGKLLPWVHIVPLADTPFNPAKSNLAWIEASLAGAVVIAPDWEEWRRPGVITYRDKIDFKFKLADAMLHFADGVTEPPHVAESREYIRKHLLLRHVNQKRWEIINKLSLVNVHRFSTQGI